MQIIALTGSIATGKSTVSTILASPPHNLPIIDADKLAHDALLPGTVGYNRVLAHFGPSTPDLLLPPSPPSTSQPYSTSPSSPPPKSAAGDDKARPINRPALSRRVFGSLPAQKKDRAVLNGIIHPLVRRAMLRSLLYHHLTGSRTVVLDIPLLYETGLELLATAVIMVACSPEHQLERLLLRNPDMGREEAGRRVGSQKSVGEKVGRTEWRGGGRGWVVWNDGGRGELGGEVGSCVGEVLLGGWGGWAWWVGCWGFPLLMVGWVGWGAVRGWWDRRGWENRGRGEWEKVEKKER